METNTFEKIVSLAKRRGFIFSGSELYGGLANTYDYGPVGVELLRNIKNAWWETFVHRRDDIVGLDASIISHQRIWDASGHTAGFADALVDCKHCKTRIRADHLIENFIDANKEKLTADESTKELEYVKKGKVEGLSTDELETIIQKLAIPCPTCGKKEWTKVRKFNLLFPVHLGIVEGEQSLAYLRGETAQGMFINFENIVNSSRVRLPFGIAQVGKSFRNEITLGNSVFRTLEFEQGEIEYFFDPESTNWEELFEFWKKSMWEFITSELGIKGQNLRWRLHTDEERSFYSSRTEDLEYNFPFGGFKELWGLGYRTNYDLKQHIQFSGKDLSITDPYTGKKVIPHVIEPAVGINRMMLMVLCDAYTEEEKRTVLKITPKLAPYKVAVFPLLHNKEQLVDKARKLYEILKRDMATVWDDRGNIGKRYFAQDEIGTPWCVTVDFTTLEDETVTVRDRDNATQERMLISSLQDYFAKKLA